MKIRFNLRVAAGIFIGFSLVMFSCGSAKRSAVPCPDFSHSRNMKSRHAQTRTSAAKSEISASVKSRATASPACDTIVIRNGDLMEAKVIETGQQEIRYRKCGDSGLPASSLAPLMWLAC